MLCNGKYYIGCGSNLQIQITKEEHERIRAIREEPLIEITENSPIYSNWIWIDDETCNQ
jgi:7,8-dihydro-6-hydroxymethylpterin-pyrophosphokinase